MKHLIEHLLESKNSQTEPINEAKVKPNSWAADCYIPNDLDNVADLLDEMNPKKIAKALGLKPNDPELNCYQEGLQWIAAYLRGVADCDRDDYGPEAEDETNKSLNKKVRSWMTYWKEMDRDEMEGNDYFHGEIEGNYDALEEAGEEKFLDYMEVIIANLDKIAQAIVGKPWS